MERRNVLWPMLIQMRLCANVYTAFKFLVFFLLSSEIDAVFARRYFTYRIFEFVVLRRGDFVESCLGPLRGQPSCQLIENRETC
jgi:hypothetical protein